MGRNIRLVFDEELEELMVMKMFVNFLFFLSKKIKPHEAV